MNNLMRLIFILLIFTSCFSKKEIIKVKKGETFYMNLRGTPTTLNPLSSSDTYSTKVQAYVVETLLVRNPETYKWRPSLAESYKISKDRLIFDFTLREGVKWHDGMPLTVEDIKFSYEAIMHPQNKYKTAHLRPYYENIKNVEIVNKRQVRFHVKNKYFLNFSTVASLSVVPRHLYENPTKKESQRLNKTLVGTGPYKLVSLKRGKGITLIKNKDWWGNSIYKNEYNFVKIFIRLIKGTTNILQRLEKGELDYSALTVEDYWKKETSGSWNKSVFKVRAENLSPKGYSFIGWNLKNVVLKSKQVRLALYKLINRKEMNEKFRYGASLFSTGPVYGTSKYRNKNVAPVLFDPAGALKILRKEGWSDADSDGTLEKKINDKKQKLSFIILVANKDSIKYLTMFKEDAKKIGVDVKIKFLEWNSFIKALGERNFEGVMLGWGGGSIEWDPKQIWHSDSAKKQGSNFISYSNAEVDALIDEARFITNPEKRKKKLQRVYEVIANDYPYAFLFTPKFDYYAHSKRVIRMKDTFTYAIGNEYWKFSP